MTLTRLLEIRQRLQAWEDERGLLLAERLWQGYGCPAEPAALSRALESILQAGERQGLRYPAILLRRRKELQRGSWQPVRRTGAGCTCSPRRKNDSGPVLPASAADGPPFHAAVEPLAAFNCELCGNKGFVMAPGGSAARLCACWQQRLAGKSASESQRQDCYTRKSP